MWLMNYITKNSMTVPIAVKGNVSNTNDGDLSIESSEQHKQLRACLPYGVYSVPPIGARAVVLPLDDGEINIGTISSTGEIEAGEIMLKSSGGASLYLKNDGTVLINGEEY